MDSKKVNDWLQISGMFGIIASLIFVGLQVKQADEIASMESLDRGAEQRRDLFTLITENADVWQRGCVGEELSTSDHVVFMNIYRVYLNSNYASWKRYKIDSASGADPQFLPDAYAANIHRFPGFRAAYESRKQWVEQGFTYSDPDFGEYNQAVQARLDELAELDSEQHFDAGWCGQ